jgi:hypothetical protein
MNPRSVAEMFETIPSPRTHHTSQPLGFRPRITRVWDLNNSLIYQDYHPVFFNFLARVTAPWVSGACVLGAIQLPGDGTVVDNGRFFGFLGEPVGRCLFRQPEESQSAVLRLVMRPVYELILTQEL